MSFSEDLYPAMIHVMTHNLLLKRFLQIVRLEIIVCFKEASLVLSF